MDHRILELYGCVELNQTNSDGYRASNRVREHRSEVAQIYYHLTPIDIGHSARARPIPKFGGYEDGQDFVAQVGCMCLIKEVGE